MGDGTFPPDMYPHVPDLPKQRVRRGSPDTNSSLEVVVEVSTHLCYTHRSKLMRKLGLISYFSPLVNMAPQHCRSFLQFVPPLEVPWNDVAVHVLHTKVNCCY